MREWEWSSALVDGEGADLALGGLAPELKLGPVELSTVLRHWHMRSPNPEYLRLFEVGASGFKQPSIELATGETKFQEISGV